jgi:hypothetical protein
MLLNVHVDQNAFVPKNLAYAVTLVTRIREVLASNLGGIPTILNEVFVVFLRPLKTMDG